MYGKLFDTMFEGTLYGHWEAIVTLQQMIILADSSGNLDMTPQVLSGRTSIPLEIIQKGIKELSDPDPDSRTPGAEGRRITLLDEHRTWGWHIVNHAKYQAIRTKQDKLEADRQRIAEKRKANKSKDVADSRNVSHRVANVAPTDTDTDTDKPKARRFAPPPWIPPESWKGFEAMRVKIRKPMTDRARAMIVAELETLKAQGHDPVAVLAQSEVRCWSGVFPIKANGTDHAPAQWWTSDEGILTKGKELRLEPKRGESMPSFKARINAAIEGRRHETQVLDRSIS